MTKDDIKVQVSPDRVLTISGERKSEHKEGSEEEGSLRIERSYGQFMRRFRLPDNVDTENIKVWHAPGWWGCWRGLSLGGRAASGRRCECCVCTAVRPTWAPGDGPTRLISLACSGSPGITASAGSDTCPSAPYPPTLSCRL